jgi:hypothetical protein
MEHDIAAREVEKTTKQAIEATGRALLKEKREAAPTSGILDIVDKIMNNLFIIEDNKDQSPPKTHLLPPYPHKGPKLGSFPILQPRIHKLSFPTFNGNEDPLPWINYCEQFFRG